MIKLLIVDDSPLMRRLLSEIFAAQGDFQVELARDGLEALAKVAEFKPDVVTLDLQMPGMDGLACLDRIMLEHPCPVVILSSLTEAGGGATLEALDLGAVDVIAKPGGAISLHIEAFAPGLVDKVRAASNARLRRSHRLAERLRLRSGLGSERETAPQAHPALLRGRRSSRGRAPVAHGAVLVGTSTGGPPALDALLSPLPAHFSWPIIVAQHMPASFTGPLARRLDKLCALTVSEVTSAVPLAAGHVYVGRGDTDVIVGSRAGGPVVLAAPASSQHRWHPSVDRLVASALEHFAAPQLIGVLMTGMGTDGAQMMARLRQEGGRTIAEAEETAVVWGMPGELVKCGGAEAVVPLEQIAENLMSMAGCR